MKSFALVLLFALVGCDGREGQEPNSQRDHMGDPEGGLSEGLNPDAAMTPSATADGGVEGTVDGGVKNIDAALDAWADSSTGNDADTDECTPAADVVETCDSEGVPSSGQTYAVSVAASSSCAILSGALYCWGGNYYGQLGIGDKLHRSLPIRVGCASDWSAISVGARGNTCGLRDGALYCWGDNSYGALGTGANSPEQQLRPTRIGCYDDWSTISAGDYNTCGIRSGELYCWGTYDYAGPGPEKVHFSPVRVGDEKDWTAVSATRMDGGEPFDIDAYGIRSGALYTWKDPTESVRRIGTFSDWMSLNDGQGLCAIRANGDLHCGFLQDPPAPIGGGGWATVSSSVESYSYTGRSCGIRQGELYCWGNVYTDESNPDTSFDDEPSRVGTHDDWVTVATSMDHSCGVRSDRVYCWGNGGSGQLGIGVDAFVRAPTPIDTSNEWTSVSVGEGLSCGLKQGTPQCWGNEAPATFEGSDWTFITPSCGIRAGELLCWGRFGIPWPDVAPIAPVNDLANWSSAFEDVNFRCGIESGQLFCWNHVEPTAPTQVGSANDWTSVTQRCGLRGGGLYRWSDWFPSDPQQVGTSSTWTAVTSSFGHSCGIDNGRLYCWGDNLFGQLGLTGGNTDEPQPVGERDDWSTVAAGRDHTCGIAAGELYCWGSNESAQLGLGTDSTIAQITTPTRVGTASNWTSVSARDLTSCAMQGGGIYCWGRNDSGQTGQRPPRRLEPTEIILP